MLLICTLAVTATRCGKRGMEAVRVSCRSVCRHHQGVVRIDSGGCCMPVSEVRVSHQKGESTPSDIMIGAFMSRSSM